MDKQVYTPLLCDLNKYFSDPEITADVIEKEAYHRVDIPVVWHVALLHRIVFS